MLIPAWVLLILGVLNTIILIVDAIVFSSWRSFILMFPMAYFVTMYALVDRVEIDTAQILGRYGIALILVTQLTVSLITTHSRPRIGRNP